MGWSGQRGKNRGQGAALAGRRLPSVPPVTTLTPDEEWLSRPDFWDAMLLGADMDMVAPAVRRQVERSIDRAAARVRESRGW